MTKSPSLRICFASIAVTTIPFPFQARAATLMLGSQVNPNPGYFSAPPPPAPMVVKAPTTGAEFTNSAPPAATRTVESPRNEQATAAESSDRQRGRNRSNENSPRKKDSNTNTNNKKPESKPDQEVDNPQIEPPKTETQVIQPENPLIGGVTAGFLYSSEYYFRGLDILDRISPDNGGSGITQWNFGYTHILRPQVDSLTLSYSRVDAYDLQLPKGDAADLPPNKRGFDQETKRFLKDNASFAVPARKKYAEDQLYLNYNRNLPWYLQADLNLGYYRFNDGRWYQDISDNNSGPINDTMEATLRLTYKGLKDKNNPAAKPWLVPSLAYTADFTGFDAQFAELDLASRSFSLPGKFGAVNFKADAGYDFGYNAEGNGWSYISGGAGYSLPLSGFKLFQDSKLVLGISADYIHSLDDERADSGPFFRVGLSSSNSLYKKGLQAEGIMSKDPLSMAAAPDYRWRVSAGTGWRTWTGNFDHEKGKAFDSLSRIKRRENVGDLGVAGPGQAARYKNGSVSGANTPGDTNPGASTFTGGTPGGSKSDTGDNKFVVFQSDRYEYDQDQFEYGFNSESEAELVSPYIHIHQDLTPDSWRGGFHFGVGALYSYSSGELDSGTQLTSLASGFETIRNYETIYAQDAIGAARFPGGPAQVVTNGAAYGNFYESSSLAAAGPQSTEFAIQNNVNRIAGFTSSTVKFQAHELAIPLEFSYDIGTRLHLALSVAPTLAFLDAELNSVTDYRDLQDLAEGKIVEDRTNYRVFNFKSIIRFDDEEALESSNQGFSGTGQASATPNVSPQADTAKGGQPDQQASGGKGGRANAPRLPGRSIKVVRDRSRSQEWTWGLTATATGRFDLDEQDRFFLEAWGRYGWLNEISISNSQSEVKVDPSNWSVGVGLGYRF